MAIADVEASVGAMYWAPHTDHLLPTFQILLSFIRSFRIFKSVIIFSKGTDSP